MTDKMGTIHRAPTLGKMRKDKGVITPTLVLPPQGGGDLKVNPPVKSGGKYMVLVSPFQEGEDVKQYILIINRDILGLV